MSSMILGDVNLNVSVIQCLASFDKRTIGLNNVPACVLTHLSSFFFPPDDLIKCQTLEVKDMIRR